ncbi:MAG TPA: BofC C-terminal domain-containing protein [Candidatus Nitrosocosmicus sp.]|nr:BofC C-terminal domain-containing protein [Candidatus Nitrosocosmicus sp.]
MFEDRSIKRKRRYMLAAIFLLLASAAFGFGYYFNAEAPEDADSPANPGKVNLQIPDSLINPSTNKNPIEPVNADSESDTATNMPGKDILTPNTQLIFKTYFNSCRHTTEKAVQASNDEVNMNEEQLKGKYTGWEITAFSPPIVELSRAVDTYCPNHYIISVNNGFIAIFVYNEDGEKILQESTDISVATLTPEDQQALAGGIVVDTEDQKEQTLEGFSD